MEKDIIEDAILLRSCKNENNGDLDRAAKDFYCIKDLLEIQKMSVIVLTFSRTKSGRLRKNSEFWNLIDKRLEYLLID